MASCNPNLGLVIVFFVVSLSSAMIHCVSVQDLDDLVRTYASRANLRRRTGSLYQITLPANLSGVEASIVMVRNSMFWRQGASLGDFHVPPRIKTTPYAKRIALLYENFGNSSSGFFRVDGYSFVSPVVGFSAYDATNTNQMGDERLNFSITGTDVISIRFDSYVTHLGKNANSIKCVAFVHGNSENNDSLEFSNMTRDYECATTSSSGHFALVIPNQKPASGAKLKWWWVASGAAGVLLVVVTVMVVMAKLVRRKRMREMERESEKSETIGHVWIGSSRMPAAASVRTQPSLEHHEEAFPP